MNEDVQFFSFNKFEDWQRGTAYNLKYSDQGMFIRGTEKYNAYLTIRLSELEGPGEIVDFAIGRGGRLFLMDNSSAIWVYDYENKLTELLFRNGHQLFSEHASIAAHADTLYVADMESRNKLSAYSVSNGQMIWSINEWNQQSIHPLAIAVDSSQHVYAVVAMKEDKVDDQDEDEDNVYNDDDVEAEVDVKVEGTPVYILRINASGAIIASFTHDQLQYSRNKDKTSQAKRYVLSVSEQGEVYLLDAETKIVIVFDSSAAVTEQFSVAGVVSPNGIAVDSRGGLLIGERRMLVQDGEDDRFVHIFDSHGHLQGKVPGFRGRADKHLLDLRDRMYVLDGESAELSILALQSRTSELLSTSLPEGIYFTDAMDTTAAETEWHKFQLDADIPEETQIHVSYCASDYSYQVINGTIVDFNEFIADQSITLQDKLKATDHLWSEPAINPRDALIHQSKGRYLWMKIVVVGSEQSSPMIRRLRIYFPRVSLLSYLPPLYQEDEKSRGFMERYLSLFESFLSEMEEKIDHISRYFDPDTVAGEYLSWLGSWLGIADVGSWGEEKIRLLIHEAPELYRMRGTREGIVRMLHIYTGQIPSIVEYFQYKEMREKSELRDLFSQLYGDNPYCFCVMLPADSIIDEQQRYTVQKILDDQKPAFTEAKLVVLQPWMYMDMHTYIGMNTYLSESTLLSLNQKSSLPYNTVLIDLDRDNRMGIHTRLELDSELE